MDPQEIKNRYQQLLEAYHAGKIDWKTFESSLLELKKTRAVLAAGGELSPESEDSSLHETKGPSPAESTPPPAGNRFEVGMNSGVLRKKPTSSSSGPFDSALLQGGGSGVRAGSRSGVRAPSATDSGISRSAIWNEMVGKPAKRGRLQVGNLLGGHYTLQRLLGHGQCGETWRAHETETDNYVVVKPIPAALQNDKSAWLAFRETFRRVSMLHQPNICPIYRLERDETVGHFMVSAFLDAFSLDDYYDRYCRTFHEFPLSAVIRVLWPVGQALDYAHRRRVVHRDLKPQNILIGKHCGSMVTDFEIGDRVRSELMRLNISTDAVDPAPWRSPEVWLTERYSARSDQFSLAAIAYFLATGSMPFRGRTLEEIRDSAIHQELSVPESLPEQAGAALRRALSKEPNDRFPSCLHFLKELAGTIDAGAAEVAGPHYARQEELSAPKRFWALLFGLPSPEAPRWLVDSVSGEPEGGLWPFKNLETTLDPKDIRISEGATYPYTEAPLPLAGASSASLFGPMTLLVGGLATAAVGTVAALALTASPKSTTPSESGNGPSTVVRQVDDVASSAGSTAPSGTLISPGSFGSSAVSSVSSDWGSGVEAIPKTDFPDFEHRAGQGDVDAQRRLGQVYFYGKGVSADYKKAAGYFELASGGGDPISLYHLGRCHEIGLGLPKDRQKAIATYRQAAAKGSEEARAALKRIEERE